MKYLLLIIILSLNINNIMIAQDGKNIPQPKSQWWLNSSSEDTSLVGKLLYHVEGTYSFNSLTGNIEGTAHKGNLLNFLRYNMLTLHANYLVDFTDIKKFADNTGKNYQQITSNRQVAELALDYDISKLFYAEAGNIWERDLNKSILNRNSYYVGLGVNKNMNNVHILSLMAAGGMVDIKYNLPSEVLNLFNVQKKPDAYLFVMQSYVWNIIQRLQFNESIKYFPNITETERYRYDVELALNCGVWDFLSFFVSYSYMYDNDSKNIDVYTTDTKTSLGIKLQY
jgi:hypothetical protein